MVVGAKKNIYYLSKGVFYTAIIGKKSKNIYRHAHARKLGHMHKNI